VVPPSLAVQIVERINMLLREIATAGFADLAQVRGHNAPWEIQKKASRIHCITGATVRVINQVGHLLSVSRRGQTAHGPMRLPRRLRLVDSALEQLAEDLGVAPQSAVDLGLLTDEVRAAWSNRDAKQPHEAAFARNLFDWAWPEPVNLSDEDLLDHIQSHPDLAYVETLRAERRRRGLMRIEDPAASPVSSPSET
jgi:hypothetical protein